MIKIPPDMCAHVWQDPRGFVGYTQGGFATSLAIASTREEMMNKLGLLVANGLKRRDASQLTQEHLDFLMEVEKYYMT